MKNNICIYSGDKPYLYVLFSYSDRARALPIVKAMKDVRTFYGVGIEYDTDPSELMKEKIEKAHAVLLFINEQIFTFRYLRELFSWLVLANKPIIAVFPEPIKLMPYAEAALASAERLPLYELPEGITASEILASMPTVAPCLKEELTEAEKTLEKAVEAYFDDKLFEAYELIMPLIEQKNKDAAMILGTMCQSGKIYPKDSPDPLYWWQTAASWGSFEGYYALAKYYGECLQDTDPDEREKRKELFEYFCRFALPAVEAGHADTEYLYAKTALYTDGHTERAVNVLLDACKAAHRGALRLAAEEFDRMDCPYRDRKLAADCRLYGAALGDVSLMRAIAEKALTDDDSDKEPEGFYFYLLASTFDDDEANYQLARLYEKGIGTNKIHLKAMRYYRSASAQGHKAASYALAEQYRAGEVINANLTHALEYYLKSGDYKDSYYRIACLYADGKGNIPRDYRKTVEYLLLESKKVHPLPEALNALGYCYEKGFGVSVDHKEANYWYFHAAVLGCAPAAFNLAHCYQNGIGCAVDLDKARHYYAKAVTLGHAEAATALLALCPLPQS